MNPMSGEAGSRKIFDCDVHHVAPEEGLRERMPGYFKQRRLMLPGILGIANPLGVNRIDAAGPDGEAPGTSPDVMRDQWLDAFGIDRAVLIEAGLLRVCVHPDVDYATVIARAYNDWLSEVWLPHDERWLGSLLVNSADPAGAAEEIRRAGERERIVQVVMSSATRIPLGDRIYWPIYDAAVSLGLPVAVHPGAEGSGISGPPWAGYPSSYLEWHTDLTQNAMAQITSLVTRGALMQFPDLRFVVVEGGFGWVPHLLWRLDKNWKGLRQTVPWVERLPSEYVVEQVRFTSQPVEEPPKREQFLQILEMMQAKRTLLFSSDYPHWDQDAPARAFPGVKGELRDRIYWRNAEELYFGASEGGAEAVSG